MDLATATSQFSARELALLAWAGAFAVWALSQPAIRRSAWGVIRAFLQWKVSVAVLALGLYTSVVVVGLAKLGMWDRSLAKDTVLWFLGAGAVTLFVLGRGTESVSALKALVRDTVQWTVALEFLLNAYSFPLWVELVTVPLVAGVVLLRATAELKAEHHVLLRPLDGCLLVYGMAVVAATIWGAATSIHDLLSIASLKAFALPVSLTLAAVLYYYLFLLVVRYEQVFLRLRWVVEDAGLRSIAKRRVLKRFHLKLAALDGWSKDLAFQRVGSLAELEALISKSPEVRAAA